MTPAAFFQKYKPVALESTAYGLFPSVVLAQAALESSYGKSLLASEHHNLFGIKAGSQWRGPVTLQNTFEYFLPETVSYIDDLFRAYDNDFESFEDHADFLKEREWYKPVLAAPTAFDQAEALQTSGYATDPAYANKLKDIITKYDLLEIDKTYHTMKTLNIVSVVLTLALAVITMYTTLKKL